MPISCYEEWSELSLQRRWEIHRALEAEVEHLRTFASHAGLLKAQEEHNKQVAELEAEVEQLRAAITRHKRDVWADQPVAHWADADLYDEARRLWEEKP